ncbi:hypothetical protein ACROYT_G007020 [Oculina patagonica]
MQRILLVKLILVASAFSFPSRKNPEKEAILDDGKRPMDNQQGFVRQERNLVQFRNMIECTTGRSAFDYSDYGCYCGYGGKGTPLDDLDRCCHIHDACYERVSKDPDLCTFSSAVYWKIYSRDDTCTGCTDPANTCERAICECDGEAARCFAKSQWNAAHYDYPADQC